MTDTEYHLSVWQAFLCLTNLGHDFEETDGPLGGEKCTYCGVSKR